MPLVPGYHGDDQDPAFLQDAGRAHRLSGADQGQRRRRRQGHAARRPRRGVRGGAGVAASARRRRLRRRRRAGREVRRSSRATSRSRCSATRHGNVVHLFERDCSVQRRHQKVIEEAPAPGMTRERRARAWAARRSRPRARSATSAPARSSSSSAGRRRLLLHGDEHPAAGRAPGDRDDHRPGPGRVAAARRRRRAAAARRRSSSRIDGHAIEARLYAEDPDRDFLPVDRPAACTWRRRRRTTHVRIDTGVEQGDEITPYYDPMIAKLIVWDRDRELALARMRQALSRVPTSPAWRATSSSSRRLVSTPAFVSADLDTALIEREEALLFPGRAEVPEEAWLLAALAELQREARAAERAAAAAPDRDSPWRRLDGWRLNGSACRTLTLRHGEQVQAVRRRVVPRRPRAVDRRAPRPCPRHAGAQRPAARAARRAPRQRDGGHQRRAPPRLLRGPRLAARAGRHAARRRRRRRGRGRPEGADAGQGDRPRRRGRAPR